MEERDSNLDTLRAISISFVIVWHIHPIAFVDLGNTWLYALLHFMFFGFLHEITVLGVPTFFLVSLYLLKKKQAEDGRYVKKRLSRLMGLCLFWTTVQTILFSVVVGEMPKLSLDSILGGGPGLPHVGGSVFYFLWNLVLLTALQYFFLKCGKAFRTTVTVIIFAVTLVSFEVSIFSKSVIPDHTSILNFLYIIPLCNLLSEKEGVFIRHRHKFFALYVVWIIHDFAAWKLFEYAWPFYCKVSVAMGIITLFSYVIRSRFPLRKAVLFSSKYSLGLFSLHKYFWLLSLWLIQEAEPVSLFGVGIETRSLGVFISAVLLTCVALACLKRVGLGRVIS